MNGTPDVKQSYLDAAAQHEALWPGRDLAWARSLRVQAAARFDVLGFPTTRDEAWKYTNVTPLTRDRFQLPSAPMSPTSAQLDSLRFAGLDAHLLVFINGQYAHTLSSVGSLPKGVYVGSLAQALRDQPHALEPHLGRIANLEQHPFAALNGAFMADGAFVHLPQGAVLERPIHLLFVSSGNLALVQPRNLLVAGEASQATVIEHYVSLEETRYFTNAVTELSLAQGSFLEHYRVQQESGQAFHIAGVHVLQARDARFTSHAIDLGGQLVRNDVRALLGAAGAECVLNGLYIVGGRQHVDNHTLIEHAKPQGTSREYYKGVLDGRSRAVFNGRVVVHPDAQQTDAQQMNNNLLLSDDAEIDTKPELEIYADDVKCSHGATVGQLDTDALFYLRSRAIDEATARDLLTYAFADDILARFRLTPIRRALERKLTARLLPGRDLKELTTA